MSATTLTPLPDRRRPTQSNTASRWLIAIVALLVLAVVVAVAGDYGGLLATAVAEFEYILVAGGLVSSTWLFALAPAR